MDRRTFLASSGTLGLTSALLAAIGSPSPAHAGVRPLSASRVACQPGGFVVNPGIRSMPAVRYQTAHFALRWKDADVSAADARYGGEVLERTWATLVDTVGFVAPGCSAATKYKVDVHLDPTFGLSGGGSVEGYPAFWVDPAALRDHFGLAHEFTHSVQFGSGGLRDSAYGGPFWETHANYMATQMAEYRSDLHGSELLVNYPHLYYGSSRDNYLCFEFLEYLKERFGFGVVNDIWTRAPGPGDAARFDADPYSVLAASRGWSVSTLNDVFAQWAMRSVTWDYHDLDGTDRGPLMRSTYGGYDDRAVDRRLRVAELDLLNATTNVWGVPFHWAPQRWGYNLVRLVPEPGATSVTVTFIGEIQKAPAVSSLPGLPNEPAAVPQPNSGWRWAVVGVDASNAPRYGTLQRSSRGSVTFPLNAGDTAVYLVVMGAPTAITKIAANQPWYSIYRYPYRIQLAGARADDGAGRVRAMYPDGHQHARGGGWVAAGAHVDSTAYVGPKARVTGGQVLGNARILDRGAVFGGTVRDNAVVRGIGTVTNRAVIRDNAVVQTSFRGAGFYNADATVGGSATVNGDLELWASDLTEGSYYGFTDDDTSRSGYRDLTAPVPEVTARPTWVRS